jgi:hypothetical protein
VDDTGVTINDQPLVTFQLRVSTPSRPAYDAQQRQVVPRLSIGMVAPGITLPVRVDPSDPEKLTLDWSGSSVMGIAGVQAPTAWAPGPTAAPVRPDTLSTMGPTIPNTLQAPDDDLAAPSMPPMPRWTGGDMNALLQQLTGLGISIPGGPASVTVMPGATIDLSPGATQTPQSTVTPGRAVVRSAMDTGVVVRGDPLFQLTLDVTPPSGATYPVSTASLVPPAARARLAPGTSVPVRIDPANQNSVVVEWMVP